MARISPFGFARRMGLSKGLLGGSRPWMVVGGIVWGGRLMRRFFGRRPEIAATETLKPGQFVTVTALAALSRSQRKAAKRR